MRAKTIISMTVVLVMALILATPVLADKARGKIGSDTIKNAGSFMLTTNEWNWITLSIKVRKMVPYQNYYVGWVQYKDGTWDKLVYELASADSKGNINYGFQNPFYYSPDYTWTFKVFASSYAWEPFDLYGPVVGLNFY